MKKLVFSVLLVLATVSAGFCVEESYLDLADEYLNKGEYNKAKFFYLEYLKLEESRGCFCGEIYFSIAICVSPEESVKWLEKALNEARIFEKIIFIEKYLYWYGNMLFQNEMYEEAFFVLAELTSFQRFNWCSENEIRDIKFLFFRSQIMKDRIIKSIFFEDMKLVFNFPPVK